MLIVFDMRTWNLIDMYTCSLQDIWQCTVGQKCLFLFKNSKNQSLVMDVIRKELIFAWYDDLKYSSHMNWCFAGHAYCTMGKKCKLFKNCKKVFAMNVAKKPYDQVNYHTYIIYYFIIISHVKTKNSPPIL